MKRCVFFYLLLFFGCNINESNPEYTEYPRLTMGSHDFIEITPPDSNYFLLTTHALVASDIGGYNPQFHINSWWKDENGVEQKEEKIVPAYGYGKITLANGGVLYLDKPLEYLPKGEIFLCGVVTFDHPSIQKNYYISLLVKPNK